YRGGGRYYGVDDQVAVTVGGKLLAVQESLTFAVIRTIASRAVEKFNCKLGTRHGWHGGVYLGCPVKPAHSIDIREILIIVRAGVAIINIVKCNPVIIQVNAEAGIVVDRIPADQVTGSGISAKNDAVLAVESNNIAFGIVGGTVTV